MKVPTVWVLYLVILLLKIEYNLALSLSFIFLQPVQYCLRWHQ